MRLAQIRAGIKLEKLNNENLDLYGIEQTEPDSDRPAFAAQRRSIQAETDALGNAFLDRGLALFGGLLIGAGGGVLLYGRK